MNGRRETLGPRHARLDTLDWMAMAVLFAALTAGIGAADGKTPRATDVPSAAETGSAAASRPASEARAAVVRAKAPDRPLANILFTGTTLGFATPCG